MIVSLISPLGGGNSTINTKTGDKVISPVRVGKAAKILCCGHLFLTKSP